MHIQQPKLLGNRSPSGDVSLFILLNNLTTYSTKQTKISFSSMSTFSPYVTPSLFLIMPSSHADHCRNSVITLSDPWSCTWSKKSNLAMANLACVKEIPRSTICNLKLNIIRTLHASGAADIFRTHFQGLLPCDLHSGLSAEMDILLSKPQLITA